MECTVTTGPGEGLGDSIDAGRRCELRPLLVLAPGRSVAAAMVVPEGVLSAPLPTPLAPAKRAEVDVVPAVAVALVVGLETDGAAGRHATASAGTR